jgi:hypothetical protein
MKPTIKPRNPLVAPSKFRKAGLHQKTFKTQRRAERISLMKSISDSTKEANKPEFQPKQLVVGCFG